MKVLFLLLLQQGVRIGMMREGEEEVVMSFALTSRSRIIWG